MVCIFNHVFIDPFNFFYSRPLAIPHQYLYFCFAEMYSSCALRVVCLVLLFVITYSHLALLPYVSHSAHALPAH